MDLVKNFGRHKDYALVVASIFFSLGVLELGLRMLDDKGKYEKVNPYATDLLDIEGPLLRVNHSHESQAYFNGDLVYDVVYKTDEHRRRSTHEHLRHADYHVILAGCSMVYGEGLPDSGTLDSQLFNFLTDANVYNYGVHGQAPNFFLSRLELRNIDNEISNPERGFLIYFLGDFHFKRMLGGLSVPYVYHGYEYEGGPNGVRRLGKYIDTHPIRSFIGLALRKITSVSLLANRLSWIFLGDRVYSDEQLEYGINILRGIRDSYEADGRKFLIFYGQYSEGAHPEVEKALKNSGLNVHFSNSKIIPIHDYHDGHPTSESNKILAKEVEGVLKAFQTGDS